MSSGLYFTIPFAIALTVIFICITVIAWTERQVDNADGFDWDDNFDDDDYLAALGRITRQENDTWQQQ